LDNAVVSNSAIQGLLALATFGGYGWAFGACYRGLLWYYSACTRPSDSRRLRWIESWMEHPPTVAKDAACGLILGSALGFEVFLFFVLQLIS
jgi:hypothetical protein